MDGLRRKKYEIVAAMISIYCKENHNGNKDVLCAECEDLRQYSFTKTQNCPFIDEGMFCSNCEVHCYDESMRAAIKVVMRYSGKRMLFRYPLATIRHFSDTRKALRRRI